MDTEQNRIKRRDKKRRKGMIVDDSARKLARIKERRQAARVDENGVHAKPGYDRRKSTEDKLPTVEQLIAGGYPDG